MQFAPDAKDKDDITKELSATFKLTDEHAAKIMRRITGRARFFRRAFDLLRRSLAA